MAASCSSSSTDAAQLEQFGLVAAHAYTLVAVKLINDRSGREGDYDRKVILV